MSCLEKSINEYHQLKIDLLKVVKRLDTCPYDGQKGMYQDIARCYSNEVKELQKVLCRKYHLKFCYDRNEDEGKSQQ
ncbi:hypothetical protein HOO54_05145 [Bacillus sp. WMMC1349]|uniref:hypothetical protein n=1 Tax=Bacillus sp. WMMC1349 TaxID=2736254 RepID=UPI0015542D9B|nr:hypothetical protein [Bacillus sp. WMMC1349]NPC90743.1 hypothetical protein [Bacillus sp. WMMC1349]NPC91643.1 hypothetical protein [Bacillus sp. WMMC1349]